MPTDVPTDAPPDVPPDAQRAHDDAPLNDIAPRPRPGYRTPVASSVEMAALFAGVLRALVGLLCFFAALLYLPSTPATPILAGVSVILVVTGNLSSFRAVHGFPSLRLIPRALVLGSAVVVALCVLVTAVWGAGAFRPQPRAREADEPPTVRFDPG